MGAASAVEMASLSPCLLHHLPLPHLSPRGNGAPLGFRPLISTRRKLLRLVARFGISSHLPDLAARAEDFLHTVAESAVSSSDVAAEASKQSTDWLSGITDSMETVLKVLKSGLSAIHAPYSYGFAIILLTVLIKGATFPLTKKQVESALSIRGLQPQVKAIQQRYAGDNEKIQLETARLYKLAGINPLAGFLPTLVTIPVWIGLYRALSNVANEGLLTEGFFWIPSLAGPTTITAQQRGSGISWLFPFVDGHPSLGWSDTLAYLVLPALLVILQYISTQITQSSQPSDPSQKSTEVVTKLLPLMIGYFALSVPSGLSLYWFTNNILSTAQQIWLQKLGGAKIPSINLDDHKLFEDEQFNYLNSQRTSFGVETKKAKPHQVENVISGGPDRGERFKQIKEKETERREQSLERKVYASRSSGKPGEQDTPEAQHTWNMDKKVAVNKYTDIPIFQNGHSGNGNALVHDETSHDDIQMTEKLPDQEDLKEQ